MIRPARLVAALTVLFLVLPPMAASARDGIISGGGVVPGYAYEPYPPYYAYPYYAYPAYPYAYMPVPEGYPPAMAPYPVPAPAPLDNYYHDNDGRTCREYIHPVIIERREHQARGHACIEPSGEWRLVD